MKTEKKFFDENDNEVEPEDAVKCVELTFDDERLVKSIIYYVEDEEVS